MRRITKLLCENNCIMVHTSLHSCIHSTNTRSHVPRLHTHRTCPAYTPIARDPLIHPSHVPRLYTHNRRYNLIIWNHNLAYRASGLYAQHEQHYEQESGPPHRKCLSYTHDRDYKQRAGAAANGKGEALGTNAWCPPRGCEHDAPNQETIFEKTFPS
jgi:hypothetical protein